MKAMVLNQCGPVSGNPLVLSDIPQPEPGPAQVRLKVSMCGVCHTDLHTVEGELPIPSLPLVPGHQVVGIVEKTGGKAARFKKGDRIGLGWINGACGKCGFCLAGRENLCPNARFTGLHAQGGYAEYALCDQDFAFALPKGFSDEHAAPLLCAGIIGYRSLRLAEIKPGGTLGLFGFGASAHIALQIATHWKCRTFVFSRSKEHQAHALSLGAAWAGRAEDKPPALLDAGIIFAPAGPLVKQALSHLRPGGTLAVNAITMSPIPQLDYSSIYMERTLRSVANYTRRDGEEFLALAAKVPVRTDVQVFGLSQANQALAALKESRVRGALVLKVA